MVTRRGLAASALCLVLTLQVLTLGSGSLVARPAFAAVSPSIVGDWTGTIEGDFIGEDDGLYGHFTRHADFTFTVDKNAQIHGTGTGWEIVGGYGNNNECPVLGRADNLELEISGYVGTPPGTNGALIVIKVTPDTYQTYYCVTGRPDDFQMHPLFAWHDVLIDMIDGNTIDSGAVHTLSGYWPASGSDTLTIHGGGSNVECPGLVITPTMPPASDPRNLIGPTGTASYRLSVSWSGTTPTKVYFDVEGGNDYVIPNFVFNPANMQASPISVLMDVSTRGVEEGEYPLTVDAWVIDPDTGKECHADRADVMLVVSGESRASVLGLVNQLGDVTVLPEVTDAGDQNAVVETGDNGKVTLNAADKTSDNTASVTTIDVGSNTEVKQYEHVDYFAKVLEDKAKTAEALAWTDNDLLKYKSPSAWEQIKDSIQEYVKKQALETFAADANVYSCLFASDANAAELCSGQSIVYVSNGDLRFEHKSYTGEAADRVVAAIGARQIWEKILGALATPNALVIPKGTELAVNVKQSSGLSTTTVTVLDGSAIVVDLVSEEIRLVNAGEKYSLETSFAGQTASSADKLESVGPDSVPHWWVMQVGDYATSKGWDDKTGPVDRTTTFTDQDTVYAWIQYLNVLPPEHETIFKYYKPDGSSFWNSTLNLQSPAPDHSSWSSYSVLGGVVDLKQFPAKNNYGRWKIDVYADDQFIQEMPFYVVKYFFVDGQFAKYGLTVNVNADDPSVKSALEESLTSGFGQSFGGSGEAGSDIEWIKATVIGTPSTDAKIQTEVKAKGQPSVSDEPTSLFDNPILFIPTKGIDGNYTISIETGGPFPSRLASGGIVDLDVGGSTVKAYEFSGNKKLAEGTSYSDMTVKVHYEKYTGMLLDFIIAGTMADPQFGSAELEFGLKASGMSVPTTLDIISMPREVSQNNDLTVSGSIAPAIDGGQVALTYQKEGGESIKRTVSITNGSFSDSYKMETAGNYTLFAEYLGSGPYLSSVAGGKTFTVTPSGCLIATAAFGSELTPQVKFLRDFRDNHILSTAAGSSFMNVFNKWYYSFSPSVADYEREQPWLQATVKTAIYPLLGILTVSEKAYSSIPGEYGAITAGLVASSLIGAVYLSPAAFAVQRFSKNGGKLNKALMMALAGLTVITAAISLLVANPSTLTVTTPIFVLVVAAASALLSASLMERAINRIARMFR